MNIYIGIDCGTSSVKVVAFNDEGDEIQKYSKENEATYFDGKAEQSMYELWNNVYESLKKLIDSLGDQKCKIKAIGVTGQGEGLWTLDQELNPIEPAWLWNDGRSSDLVNQLKADKQKYEALKLELGTFLKPGSTLTLLKWLKENDRERYNQTSVIFSCKDWIRYKLTGNVYWELSDATCSNVNLQTKQYSTMAYELLEIEEVKEKLPELIASIDESGILSEELATEFNLNQRIPISGGMIDIVATAAGQGAVNEKDISIIMGTTGMTFSVLNTYTADLKFNGWETHMDSNQYIKGMGTMAATPNLDWIISVLSLERKQILESVDEDFKDYQPFQSGVIYHPHISVSGERAPFYNEKATAQFLGMKQSTTTKDLIHSVLEGVVFSINDCLLDVCDKENVYVSGGGSNSLIWLQILSDCLGVEIKLSKGKELAAKGAVLSAIYMLNKGDIPKGKVETFCQTERTISPNSINHQLYKEIFKLYKDTQDKMTYFWDRRNELIEKRESNERKKTYANFS